MTTPAPPEYDAVTQTVFEILNKKRPDQERPIEPDTPLESLGIDSLDLTEVLFDLESAFNIEIPDAAVATERLNGFPTAGDIIGVVKSLIAEHSPP